MIYIFLKNLLTKDDLNTVKANFCDIIGCSIRVYKFMLLKNSIDMCYIPNAIY